MSNQEKIISLLDHAVQMHQASQLEEAEELYNKVLILSPHQYDALNLLGVIADQRGNTDQAINLFNQAINASPNLVTAHYNKANTLRDNKQLGEAEVSYKNALTCNPKSQDALLNLGVILQDQNRTEEALAKFLELIKIAPKNAKAHYNKGKTLHKAGNLSDAEKALKKAIKLDPSNAYSHFALANICDDLNKNEDAIKYIQKAIEIRPEWGQAYLYQITILKRNNLHAKALKVAKDSVNYCERSPLSLICMAWAENENSKQYLNEILKDDQLDHNELTALANIARDTIGSWAAIQLLDRSISIKENEKALNNLGANLDDLSFFAPAKVFYESAMKLNKDYLKTIKSFGCALLRNGELKEGWEILSKRLFNNDFISSRASQTPFWKGEDLSSKVLFIFFEEGAGEHILQASMIRSIMPLVKKCIIQCSNRLVPIIQRSYPNVEVISGLDDKKIRNAIDEADFQIPGINLGSYTRQHFNDFKNNQSGYLSANNEIVKKLRQKYIDKAKGKKIIGISWISGSNNHGKYKSIDLNNLLPIIKTQNVFFVSLQYGSVSNELKKLYNQTGNKIYFDDSVDQIKDLEQFFGQVAAMDLVISISNTTVHTAGALGIPTWLMIPNGRGSLWFWFTKGMRSPWYPSVRLFRQTSTPEAGKAWWPAVVDDVTKELSSWLKKPPPSRTVS